MIHIVSKTLNFATLFISDFVKKLKIVRIAYGGAGDGSIQGRDMHLLFGVHILYNERYMEQHDWQR